MSKDVLLKIWKILFIGKEEADLIYIQKQQSIVFLIEIFSVNPIEPIVKEK